MFHVELYERLPRQQNTLIGGWQADGGAIASGKNGESTLTLGFADENR
jgi:hypothetical protein